MKTPALSPVAWLRRIGSRRREVTGGFLRPLSHAGTGLRYAWAENPIISIENGAGLSLRPLRIDLKKGN